MFLTVWNTDRLGVAAFFTGNWPRARAHFERALDLVQQVGLTQGHGYGQPLLERGRVLLALGERDAGSRDLEAVLALFEGTGESVLRRVAQGQLAERDILAGDPAAARARLVPLLDQPGLEERMVTEYILPVLAWAQLELGETNQAAATVREAIRRARVGTCPFGLIHALRVAALVATEQGRWDEAERALEEGLALARGLPYPHSEGRLLHAYGRLHARKDEPARARARLDAALAIFARLGARTDSERAERDLAGLQS